MASKLRVEFVRLRKRDSNGTQDLLDVSNVAPATAAVSVTALTEAGRITAPASVNGQTVFHGRFISDVECIVTIAPAGDAGTSFDAAVGKVGGVHIPANQPVLLPLSAGQKISAITGTFA